MTGLLSGYDAHKAAQVVAYFALKAGGQMNVLKLTKLVYLAEREFMDRYDEPMIFDRLVSMDHGPVPSITLNLINGMLEHEEWTRIVEDRSQHDVGVVAGIEFADLCYLSRSETGVLDALWEKFGSWRQYRLRDHTPEICKEWENPNGSSNPIPHERVFKFLNKNDSDKLAADVAEHRSIAKSLAEANWPLFRQDAGISDPVRPC